MSDLPLAAAEFVLLPGDAARYPRNESAVDQWRSRQRYCDTLPVTAGFTSLFDDAMRYRGNGSTVGPKADGR